MKHFHFIFLLGLAALVAFNAPAFAQMRDRVGDDFGRADINDDGKLTPVEWHRRGNFVRLDTDGDGYLSLPEVRALYEGHDNRPYDWPPAGLRRSTPERDLSLDKDWIDSETLDRKTKCAIARGRMCDPGAPVKRGLLETGLGPVFPNSAVCHGIDDTFALDYTFKRSREAYHGGIDLPARWGTPMIAAAAGTVVGKFQGDRSARGIEIVLRHTPEDTGLPVWVYTGYGHLDRMPDLDVGQRIGLGEIIGPTGNSGVSGRKKRKQSSLRRPAIHFSAFYSETEKFAIHRDVVVPVQGHWVDPVALYRQKMPLESEALKNLPDEEKGVPIAVIFEDGQASSASAKFVWPYMCGRG